jgi:Uma2 family endonuclease
MDSYWLRQEAPITTADSEPEPDISVVRGREAEYANHPSTAILVVEISVSTVREDRAMASIYAAAQVEEYWLFNAPAREVEIFRQPVDGVYLQQETLAADAALTCGSLPGVNINLAELWSGLPE